MRLDGIQKILPHRCATFEESLEEAFEKIKQNTVTSTWMDSWEMPEDDHWVLIQHATFRPRGLFGRLYWLL